MYDYRWGLHAWILLHWCVWLTELCLLPCMVLRDHSNQKHYRAGSVLWGFACLKNTCKYLHDINPTVKKLSFFTPPGVGSCVALYQPLYLPLPLAIVPAALLFQAFPVRTIDHAVSGHQHLHQHEMLLCGVCPDLSAMAVGHHDPAAVAAARGGEISPLGIYLGLAFVVIHKYLPAQGEPAIQVVLQVCLFELRLLACHANIYSRGAGLLYGQ